MNLISIHGRTTAKQEYGTSTRAAICHVVAQLLFAWLF